MKGIILLKTAIGKGLALAATAASAQTVDINIYAERPDDRPLTERVAYDDLNLASASGERSLTMRVRRASRNVCAPLDQATFRLKNQACRSGAWHGAQPQMSLAIERARQIASSGQSAIPAVAITIAAH
ncbi:UrcA family protein [Sphingomonas sp. GCM10030256]|uniref:UrcA family protein n=1 Tax=Sphingomonas sp. GCM10030256 TaxID=3273427 RepID=UPI00361F051B